nr:nero [Cucujiformia]
YCFGQMQDVTANPVLVDVLRNRQEHPMVRHEAAEALGAIGSPESLQILQEFALDPVVEVQETCQLALERIKWLNDSKTSDLTSNPYKSVDPAPSTEPKSVAELKETLLDHKQSLFNRYRAMFSLRNLRTPEATKALGAGLKCPSSALFRHEVAFVLGQLQDVAGVPFLIESLEDEGENEMVRHECA